MNEAHQPTLEDILYDYAGIVEMDWSRMVKDRLHSGDVNQESVDLVKRSCYEILLKVQQEDYSNRRQLHINDFALRYTTLKSQFAADVIAISPSKKDAILKLVQLIESEFIRSPYEEDNSKLVSKNMIDIQAYQEDPPLIDERHEKIKKLLDRDLSARELFAMMVYLPYIEYSRSFTPLIYEVFRDNNMTLDEKQNMRLIRYLNAQAMPDGQMLWTISENFAKAIAYLSEAKVLSTEKLLDALEVSHYKFPSFTLLKKFPTRGGFRQPYLAIDDTGLKCVVSQYMPNKRNQDYIANGEMDIEAIKKADALSNPLRMNHPNLRPELAIPGAEGWVVQKYYDRTLEEEVQRDFEEHGQMDSKKIVIIASQIAKGLQYLHFSQGIVHGDLSPKNIGVIDFEHSFNSKKSFAIKTDQVMICDTGTARSLEQKVENSKLYMGSRSIRAPEVDENHSPGYEADIWAFGCNLFYMLTGEMPFEPENVSKEDEGYQEAVKDVIDNHYEERMQMLKGKKKKLVALTKDCLIRDPQNRKRRIPHIQSLNSTIFNIQESYGIMTMQDTQIVMTKKAKFVNWILSCLPVEGHFLSDYQAEFYSDIRQGRFKIEV